MSNDIVARLRRDCMSLIADEAADEIERLRKELGQVSDADSWVSESDAAHLDSLLNWCEFNAMDWHRALARLVNDRARLRGEVNRLRDALRVEQEELAACCIDRRETQRERDEARRKICEIESQCICDPPRSPQKYASLFGWDCFKENTDDQ